MIETTDTSLCAQIVDIALLIHCDSVDLSYGIGQLCKVQLLIERVEIALVKKIDSSFECFDPINIGSKDPLVDQSPLSSHVII